VIQNWGTCSGPPKRSNGILALLSLSLSVAIHIFFMFGCGLRVLFLRRLRIAVGFTVNKARQVIGRFLYALPEERVDLGTQ